METATNIIIALAAAGLFVLGGILAWQNKTSACATVLGFAFLLAVLLLVSKFKHVRGFGFEAPYRTLLVIARFAANDWKPQEVARFCGENPECRDGKSGDNAMDHG